MNTPIQLLIYKIINLIFENQEKNATGNMTDEVKQTIQNLLTEIDKKFFIFSSITVDDYVKYKKYVTHISKEYKNIPESTIKNMERHYNNINNCECIETCLYNDLVEKNMIEYIVETADGNKKYDTTMLNNAVTLHGNFKVEKNVSGFDFTVKGLKIMRQDDDLIAKPHTLNDLKKKIKETYNSLIMNKVELKYVTNNIQSETSRVAINNFGDEQLNNKKNDYQENILEALANVKKEKNDNYIRTTINNEKFVMQIQINKSDYNSLKRFESVLINNAIQYNKKNDEIKSDVKKKIFYSLGELVNQKTNVSRLIDLIKLMPEECNCDGTSCKSDGLLCYREMFF